MRLFFYITLFTNLLLAQGGINIISNRIGPENVSNSFTAQTSVTIVHNLNTLNIVVDCRTSSGTELANTISAKTNTSVTITFGSSSTGSCTVNGTGGVGPAGPPGSGGGSGLTSVGLSLPNIFSVTNTPLTTNGVISATFATQVANRFFGSADGVDSAPTFRSLVEADIPVLNFNTKTSGLIPLTRLVTCSEGQIPKIVSGAWACAADTGGGTITSALAALPATCSTSDAPRYVTDYVPPQFFHCYATNTWGPTQMIPHPDASLSVVVVNGQQQIRVTPGIFALEGSTGGTSPSSALIAEDWLTGRSTSTGIDGIGLGWERTICNAAPTYSFVPEASRPGVLQITTASGGVDCAGLTSPSNTVTAMNTTTNWSMTSIVKTPALTTSLAEINTGLGNQTANGIQAVYRPGVSANWLLRTCAAFSCTTTDSGVLVTTSTWYKIIIDSTVAGTVGISINGSARVTTTATIPSAEMRIVPAYIETTAGAARSVSSDYFLLSFTGLTR